MADHGTVVAHDAQGHVGDAYTHAASQPDTFQESTAIIYGPW